MYNPRDGCFIAAIGLILSLLTTACIGPRLLVATGTLVGLEAAPGNPDDGQTPAVTFGYRRAEVALVPVEKQDNNKVVPQDTSVEQKQKKDAASILATFNLAHNWFGPAKIEQYIATGLASRDILKSGQFALILIGYEQGEDPLADKLADAYRSDNQTCWKAVTQWMQVNFPRLPPADIVTRGFIKQRPNLIKDDEVKEACPGLVPAQP